KYYTLLEAEGEGHLVGVNLSMQSYDKDLQFLEGDEMVYVDGEQRPSMRGTGTEDYFNSGWYFNQGEFAAPYHGLILKDDSLGRIAAYRFHVLDVIPFKKSIRALIEHGDNNQEIADYSSTAYWYQKEPHRPFAAMLPAGLRIPLRVQVPNGALEAESLKPMATGLRSHVEDMSAFGADWSGLKQLRIDGTKEGDSFSLSLPGGEERYDVALYYAKGPDYANVEITANGQKLGTLQGYEKTVVPGGAVLLKDIPAQAGQVTLHFAVTGREKRSTGYGIGLDAFVMRPRRAYIPAWLLAGPFPNPVDAQGNRLGLDAIYPPERDPDPAKTYTGVDGQTVAWRKVTTPEKGRVDLYMFDPYELVVVYARTDIISSKDQTLPLLLGSDDGVKVFLNGREIHRVLKVRIAQPDMDTVPLTLKKGVNTLLLKIENNFGGYNFYARIRDPEHTLHYELPVIH
ncbi:MAG TPA: glycoside hydrolase family 172 protein, partial [Bacteroidota bacterium]